MSHCPMSIPSGKDSEEKDQVIKSPYAKNSSQLPSFGPARRAAICSVIEEEQLYHGVPLTELRKDLILRYQLIKIGLL